VDLGATKEIKKTGEGSEEKGRKESLVVEGVD